MPNLTIRNLPAETHRAIKARAKAHGRSTEAEIREILAQSVDSEDRIRLGTELARLGAQFGGIELDIRRDPSPIEPARFD